MVELRCTGSGSSGNAYALIADSEILLLDAGVSIKEIKKMCDWNVADICGCLVTHEHLDHSKSLVDVEQMGIPIYAPYRNDEPMRIGGRWRIQSFDLTSIDGEWAHTNADGTPCPCYGFLITHPAMGRFLYITDTEFVKWRFKEINHMLIGTNYDGDLADENTQKRSHVYRGHMSLQTACDFVSVNETDALRNVIMCHLSKDNAEPKHFIEKMKETARNANVDVAERGKRWILEQ